MTQPRPNHASDFLTVATKRSLLSIEVTSEIALDAEKRGVSPEQVVIERGLLEPAEVDMLQMLARPRDVIPGYEIIEILGRGGMGVVFRARQLNLDRVVALKTVAIHSGLQASALARFEQEARTAGQFQHPHIVAAIDFGRHEGRLYLAMELIEGEDLSTMLEREGRMTEAATWGVLRQAASGLAHAARFGVVHRDIKPANLLLVEPPDGIPIPRGQKMVKIADFGLALLRAGGADSDKITQAGITLGSPRYMAPEQIESSAVDLRADIYALGATAYHMLSGKPPFRGNSTQQILMQKLAGRLDPIAEVAPGVSLDFAALVHEMMAQEPGQRPADYATLLQRLDALLAGSTNQAMIQRASRNEATQELSTATVAGRTSALPTKYRGEATLDSIAGLATSPEIAARPRRSRRGMLAVAVMVLLGALLAVFAREYRRRGYEAARPPKYEPTGRFEYLFDGEKLSRWRPETGAWHPAQGPEGERVLEGEGRASCSIKSAPPMEHFAISLLVNLHTAETAELIFAPVVEGEQLTRVYVVNLSAQGARLLRVNPVNNNSEQVKPTLPLPPRNDAEQLPDHEVRVARQGDRWWISVDGKHIGHLSANPSAEIPEIRLKADGGAAHFTQISLEELRPVAVAE